MSEHRYRNPQVRALTRLLTAALVAGSTALAFVPVAQAATDTVLTPTTEGWYQPNPSCASPLGCQPPPTQPPSTSPYPARSMHIGLSAGQETARSYLGLPLTGVIGTATAATLTVPLDTTQGGGSTSPELAKIQVCLTTAALTAVDGSFDAPPKTECTATAAVAYVATPEPHLQADLAPLLNALPTATGIVLLPDATKAAPTDSWRVVFSAHDRTDSAKTPPAAVTLTLQNLPANAPITGPVFTPADKSNSGFAAVDPPAGTGFAPLPSINPPVTATAVPAVEPPTTINTTPLTQPQTVTFGYAYPGVWLLPLVFLILVPTIGQALTKDLTPAL